MGGCVFKNECRKKKTIMSKNLKMKNVRDSNMELLRIVAMLLVMIVHADFASLSVPTIEQCNASPLISFMRFFC